MFDTESDGNVLAFAINEGVVLDIWRLSRTYTLYMCS